MRIPKSGGYMVGTATKLLRFREAEEAAIESLPHKIIIEWLSSYVMQPHPSLGRRGAVCPFVKPALKLDALWLAAIPNKALTEDSMCRLVLKYMKRYQKLEPTIGEPAVLKSLILIFPKIETRSAYLLIESVKDKMKLSFVEAGLMLGEFYPSSTSPGLHNSDFHPLISPIPLFVYRRLLPDDLVFLTKETDLPGHRIGFISNYLKYFGDRLSNDWSYAAREALRNAEAELQQEKR